MRKIISALAVLLIAPALLCAQSLKGKDVKPASVQFDSENYYLSYSVQDANGGWLNEYLRQGENVNSWIKMVAVRDYGAVKTTPRQAASSVAQNLKATNPQANYAMSANSKTGEVMIDFFTWSPTGDIMEFNVFKFANINGSLVSYQFAFREYKDINVMKKFLEGKNSYVNKVADVVIPKTQKVIKE